MSIKRYFIALAIVLTLFLIGLSFLTLSYLNDHFSWKTLYEEKVFSIPSGVFLLSVSLLFSITLGWFASHKIQQHLDELHYSVRKIDSGLPDSNLHNKSDFLEFERIHEQLQHLRKKVERQAEKAQQMTNLSREQEEKIQKETIVKERNRLARELHDSVSQQLFAASMMLSAVNENDTYPPEQKKQLELIEETIVQAQSEMRGLLLQLRPVQLKGIRLVEGVENLLIELANKQSMKISWKIDDFSLKKGVENHLFRIIQEGISNTLRHAKAQTLEVYLLKKDGIVFLKIIDDGIGFSIKDEKFGSYGLTSIKERTDEIGGNLKLISFPGKGTSIEVKVPILEKGNDQ